MAQEIYCRLGTVNNVKSCYLKYDKLLLKIWTMPRKGEILVDRVGWLSVWKHRLKAFNSRSRQQPSLIHGYTDVL